MISIVDYGMGNLRSVSKAFETQGYAAHITSSPDEIRNANGLVLPGVGAFGECMANLERHGLVEPIKEYISSGRPFLGICLGFQILFETSEESPGVSGLGHFKGKVVRFPDFGEKRIKVPQMGWNRINFQPGSPVLNNIPEGTWFYFVHSYYVKPESNGLSVITSNYGIEFAAAVEKDNIFACQFHPEKSGQQGLELVKNFARLTI